MSLLNAPPTPQLCTLSLHDALPICNITAVAAKPLTPEQEKSVEAMYQALYGDTPSPNGNKRKGKDERRPSANGPFPPRSEEHTSELQSPCNLVCRLLLEKKKKQYDI